MTVWKDFRSIFFFYYYDHDGFNLRKVIILQCFFENFKFRKQKIVTRNQIKRKAWKVNGSAVLLYGGAVMCSSILFLCFIHILLSWTKTGSLLTPEWLAVKQIFWKIFLKMMRYLWEKFYVIVKWTYTEKTCANFLQNAHYFTR